LIGIVIQSIEDNGTLSIHVYSQVPSDRGNVEQRDPNKEKHLTIAAIAVIATSLIIPYQIFAQNQGQGSVQGVAPVSRGEEDLAVSAIPTPLGCSLDPNQPLDRTEMNTIVSA
jgi:hypothetical protein